VPVAKTTAATLMLLAFYWAIEVLEWRRWAFPLVVVGMHDGEPAGLRQRATGGHRLVEGFTFQDHLGAVIPRAVFPAPMNVNAPGTSRRK